MRLNWPIVTHNWLKLNAGFVVRIYIDLRITAYIQQDVRKAPFSRFAKIFISWAMRSVKNQSTDQYEAIAILREYINVCRNKQVNPIYMFRAYSVLITLNGLLILRKIGILRSNKVE